jgi:hypothetical protein
LPPGSGYSPPSTGNWVLLVTCALVILACLWYWVRVLGYDMAETVTSPVSEVIPGITSVWPAYMPRDDRGEEYQARPTAFPFSVVLIVLFGAYAVAVRAAAGVSSGHLTIFVFASGAVFLALLATLPYMYAADVYSYAAYGRMFALFHIDPAVQIVKLPPDDPYTKLWGEHLPTSSYGPLWTLVSAGVAFLATKNVGMTVLLYRGLAALAALGAAALIARCLRRIAPAQITQGVVFFLWNPLVLVESALSGHNDVVMAALFLAGISMHLFGRRFLATFFFSLSVLIKFATAPLIPIYLVMVLRQLPDWQKRIGFLAQAAVAGVIALTLTLIPLHSGSQDRVIPAAAQTDEPKSLYGSWIFEQGYINSLHELLFRAFRLQMGEQADDVRDVEFQGWWITPTKPTDLQLIASPNGQTIERLGQGTPLLVVQRYVDPGHDWLRVYEPQTGRKGYVSVEETDAIDRPAFAERDSALLRWERGRSPTAVRADFVIKTVGWAAFALAWLAALVYARDVRRFVLAATSLMLASYWLINSAFYAWYVVWALAFAALVPTSAPALLAALLSATALTIYATTSFDGIDGLEWIFTYRSLPALGLPLMLFAGACAARRLRARRVGASLR